MAGSEKEERRGSKEESGAVGKVGKDTLQGEGNEFGEKCRWARQTSSRPGNLQVSAKRYQLLKSTI